MRDRAESTPPTQEHANRRAFLLLLVITLTLSLAAVLLFDHAAAHTSVFTLSNLIGPTALTLLHGQGLTVCTEAMGTPANPICFHAARMPLPSAIVALGAALFGNHLVPIALLKATLLLAPLEAAIYLVTRRLRTHRNLTAALLLLPFLLTPFLADVVNLQVEEGYTYSLLALAFALLLFPIRRATFAEPILFGLSAAMLYLGKSAMAPAVAVLTLLYLLQRRRQPALAALALLLVLAAPAGWALWQHHTSGRYTLGTSLDGINLHKGNDDTFLVHYPPAPGTTLDQYDADLNRGHTFPNEWTFNDFHQRAAILFIRTHPAATAQGLERKLVAIFITTRKLGSDPAHGPAALLETAGILIFRLLLWTALALALLSLLRPRHRFAATAFLLLVAAVALPYLLGFAYTRHVSVLIYPSVLLLCWLLQPIHSPPPNAEAVH